MSQASLCCPGTPRCSRAKTKTPAQTENPAGLRSWGDGGWTTDGSRPCQVWGVLLIGPRSPLCPHHPAHGRTPLPRQRLVSSEALAGPPLSRKRQGVLLAGSAGSPPQGTPETHPSRRAQGVRGGHSSKVRMWPWDAPLRGRPPAPPFSAMPGRRSRRGRKGGAGAPSHRPPGTGATSKLLGDAAGPPSSGTPEM